MKKEIKGTKQNKSRAERKHECWLADCVCNSYREREREREDKQHPPATLSLTEGI